MLQRLKPKRSIIDKINDIHPIILFKFFSVDDFESILSINWESQQKYYTIITHRIYLVYIRKQNEHYFTLQFT
jgi:hypothetical protein